MRLVAALLVVLCVSPASAAPRRALVVLGAGAGVEGWANPLLVERVCRGAALYHEGKAKTIIMSGGYTAGHIAEAEMMRAAAVAMGVPAKDILLENSSVTTAENGDFTRVIAKRLGIRGLTVVTHHSHLERALGEFKRGGPYWDPLDGVEADGFLSTACFRAAWPANPAPSTTTYDMLVVDIGREVSIEEDFSALPDVPSPEMLHAVGNAVWRYRTGGAKRLYFTEPFISTITASGVLGQAHGHLSHTELARILATAMGVPLDDLFISSGRRFGGVNGSIEPEDNPWLRIPNARLAIAASPSHRDWWRQRFADGLNASLTPPEFLAP